MKVEFNSPEIVEAYLKNQLPDSLQKEFKNELEQNPELKKEVDFQREITESLGNYRKSSLKARLNNVKVGGIYNISPLQVAASVTVAALLTYGTFLYFQENKPADKDNTVKIVSSEETIATQETIINKEERTEQYNPLPEPKTEKTANNTGNYKTENQKETTRKENIISPDLENDIEKDILKNDNSKQPKNNLALSNTTNISKIEIVNEKSNENGFFYKYLNKKLYLIGDFSSAPYELLELNTKNKRKLYLYHNQMYYLINENQLDITSLKRIQDPALIVELNSFRENKTIE